MTLKYLLKVNVKRAFPFLQILVCVLYRHKHLLNLAVSLRRFAPPVRRAEVLSRSVLPGTCAITH